MQKCRQKKYTTTKHKKAIPLDHKGFCRKRDLSLYLGSNNGLYSRLRFLEEEIQNKTLEGDREGFRKAVKEYLELWISVERGES